MVRVRVRVRAGEGEGVSEGEGEGASESESEGASEGYHEGAVALHRKRGWPTTPCFRVQGLEFTGEPHSQETPPSLSSSESNIFKAVSQELCPSDGRSCHITADGRRPCEGARHCHALFLTRGCRGPASKARLAHHTLQRERREKDIRLRALRPPRPHALAYLGGCDQEQGVVECPWKARLARHSLVSDSGFRGVEEGRYTAT